MRRSKLSFAFTLLAMTLAIAELRLAISADFESLPVRSCSLNVLPPTEPLSPVDLGSISQAVPAKNILLKDAPVKDQGGYGCCWISTTLAKWERETLKKFGKVIPLSENHMALATLFYRIEEGIHYGSEISAGGWAQASEWMAAKVGLVPETAWTPKIDIRDTGVGKETHAYLNQEIAKFQSELVAMKEGGKTEKQAWAAASRKKSELYKYMRERFGNFPSTFKIDGVEYTPNSFSKTLIGKGDGKSLFIFDPIEEPVAKPAASIAVKLVTTERSLFTLYPGVSKFLPVTKNKLTSGTGKVNSSLYKLYFRSSREGVYELDGQVKYIHEEIVKALQDGQAVHLNTWMAPAYYSSSTGVMSIKAHGGTLELAKDTKVTGGHAVLITGVYRDANDAIVGYRIQNSWSPEKGDLGYYYMDIDYFEAFLMRVGVYKKI